MDRVRSSLVPNNASNSCCLRARVHIAQSEESDVADKMAASE